MASKAATTEPQKGCESNGEPTQTVAPQLCLKCNSPAVERNGQFGPFLSCSRFPQCRWSSSTGGKRKRPKLGEEKAKLMLKDMKLATQFIKDVGSIDRAVYLIRAVSMLAD